MDAILHGKAEQLAGEIATQAQTLDDLNGLLPRCRLAPFCVSVRCGGCWAWRGCFAGFPRVAGRRWLGDPDARSFPITLFDFPPPIRKAIYTTNAIESINSVIRKFTRNRKQYPNAESALKLIYLAIHEASQRWTMPIRGWKQALNHFAIMFEDRLPASARN